MLSKIDVRTVHQRPSSTKRQQDLRARDGNKIFEFNGMKAAQDHRASNKKKPIIERRQQLHERTCEGFRIIQNEDDPPLELPVEIPRSGILSSFDKSGCCTLTRRRMTELQASLEIRDNESVSGVHTFMFDVIQNKYPSKLE